MNTNINPNCIPIKWADLLELCSSCGLTKKGPLSMQRYSFKYRDIGVIHQAKLINGDEFGKSGYFNGVYGEEGNKWRGHPITRPGQIHVIETIDPNAPMTKEGQVAFATVVDFVISRRK